jgi:hypothetical protein
MSEYRKFTPRSDAAPQKTLASLATLAEPFPVLGLYPDTDKAPPDPPKTQIGPAKPAKVAKVGGTFCVQCNTDDEPLWRLDAPSGSITIHEECARFWRAAPPAPPSAAVYHGVSADPGGIATKVTIFELPPGQHYRKVLVALMVKCPDRVPEKRWRMAVEDAKAFLGTWGEQAHSLGWSARDLFGLAPAPERPGPGFDRLARYDCLGLIWALQGRKVVAITADSATIKTKRGTLNFYRHSRPGLGPLGDSLDDFQ